MLTFLAADALRVFQNESENTMNKFADEGRETCKRKPAEVIRIDASDSYTIPDRPYIR